MSLLDKLRELSALDRRLDDRRRLKALERENCSDEDSDEDNAVEVWEGNWSESGDDDDEDRGPPPGKLYCSVCKAYQSEDSFSGKQAMVLRDSERFCLRHTGTSSYNRTYAVPLTINDPILPDLNDVHSSSDENKDWEVDADRSATGKAAIKRKHETDAARVKDEFLAEFSSDSSNDSAAQNEAHRNRKRVRKLMKLNATNRQIIKSNSSNESKISSAEDEDRDLSDGNGNGDGDGDFDTGSSRRRTPSAREIQRRRMSEYQKKRQKRLSRHPSSTGHSDLISDDEGDIKPRSRRVTKKLVIADDNGEDSEDEIPLKRPPRKHSVNEAGIDDPDSDGIPVGSATCRKARRILVEDSGDECLGNSISAESKISHRIK